MPKGAPLLAVPDVLEADRACARRASAMCGQVHRRHRLGRQDRHQGGAAAGAFGRRCDACVGGVLQQPLGRAVVARALPGQCALRRTRNRHESRGRDRAADPPGAPACGDRHHRRAGASGVFRFGRGHRRRQGGNLRGHRTRRGGGHQPRQSAFRPSARPRRGFGRVADRCVRRAPGRRRAPDQVCASGRFLHRAGPHPGRGCNAYKLGAPGRHVVDNSLAVLAAASLAGADLALAALALANLEASGRTRCAGRARNAGRAGAADRRKLQCQSGLDARRPGAARPGAGRSARPAHRGAGRHAGTRRTRRGTARIAGQSIVDNAVDLVFCAGPLYAACGRLFPRNAGAAMPTPRRRSNRWSSRRFAPAMRS
jgi:hypothetical protein